MLVEEILVAEERGEKGTEVGQGMGGGE